MLQPCTRSKLTLPCGSHVPIRPVSKRATPLLPQWHFQFMHRCRVQSFVTTSASCDKDNVTAFRKQLKDEVKARKGALTGITKRGKPEGTDSTLEAWELTVGIEIHAQLNTARKLFSCVSQSKLSAITGRSLRPSKMPRPLPIRLPTLTLRSSILPYQVAFHFSKRRLCSRPSAQR